MIITFSFISSDKIFSIKYMPTASRRDPGKIIQTSKHQGLCKKKEKSLLLVLPQHTLCWSKCPNPQTYLVYSLYLWRSQTPSRFPSIPTESSSLLGCLDFEDTWHPLEIQYINTFIHSKSWTTHCGQLFSLDFTFLPMEII